MRTRLLALLLATTLVFASVNTQAGFTGSLTSGLTSAVTFGLSQIDDAVDVITWLLSFNLDTVATIPDDGSKDAVDGGTSVIQARVWDSTSGLLIEEVPAGVAVSEGMIYATSVNDRADFGPNLLDDPSFDTGTGWSTAGNISISGGQAIKTVGAFGRLQQTGKLTIGKSYRFKIVLSEHTGTDPLTDIGIGQSAGGGSFAVHKAGARTAEGEFTASAATTFQMYFFDNSDVVVDSAELYEIIPNFQSISKGSIVACWGDSLTLSAVPLSYPTNLGQRLITNETTNNGVGGDTSTQIKTRLLASPTKNDDVIVIWAGRNNFADTATVISDVAAMVAALSHTNYLVLSVTNADFVDEYQGGSDYTLIQTINTSLALTYGTRFVDVRSALVAAFDPTIPQDVIDNGRDVPPSSLRGDQIHFTSEGYNVVVDEVFLAIQQFDISAEATGTKLHPTKQLTENGVTSTVFLLYDYRQDSEVVNIGDHRYTTGTDNHNYSLTCSTGGTTHSSPPNVATADIGSTVAEGGGTVVWDVDHYYSNLAGTTASANYLPHVLNELAATNFALQSQDFSTWIATRSSFSVNTAISPNGFLNADKLVEDATASASHTATRGNTINSGQLYTYSIYVKAAGRPETLIQLGSGFIDTPAAFFDVSAGTIGSIAAGSPNPKMESLGDGWYRCSISGTSNATLGATNIQIVSAGETNVYNGDGVSGLFLWQTDLVESSDESSPITTTTGTVTRDATEFLVTPDTEEYLRLRFADVIAQDYLLSGTIAVNYDGTDLTVTDGTNAMTHTVAMAVGDQITIKESTGQFYYNGSLADTNVSYSPSWGEISLGNAVDYTFSADLDPTDTDWNIAQ